MFSEIIAGTMRWGVWGANLTPKKIQELIEVCLEEKIRHLIMPISMEVIQPKSFSETRGKK